MLVGSGGWFVGFFWWGDYFSLSISTGTISIVKTSSSLLFFSALCHLLRIKPSNFSFHFNL